MSLGAETGKTERPHPDARIGRLDDGHWACEGPEQLSGAASEWLAVRRLVRRVSPLISISRRSTEAEHDPSQTRQQVLRMARLASGQGHRRRSRRDVLRVCSSLPPLALADPAPSNSSLNNTTAFSSKKFAQAFKPGSRKPAFDPLTKTGLLPRTNVSILEGAKTYVVAGSGSNVSRVGKNAAAGLRAAAIQSGNGAGGFIQGVRDGPTVERAKRDVREAKVAKARRIEEARELMERDKGTSLGGRYVELADKKRREVEREFVKRNGGAVEEEGGKRRRKGEKSESEKEEVKEKKRRRTFTTAAVRLIGYDPTTKGAAERDEDDESKRSRVRSVSFRSVLAAY